MLQFASFEPDTEINALELFGDRKGKAPVLKKRHPFNNFILYFKS